MAKTKRERKIFEIVVICLFVIFIIIFGAAMSLFDFFTPFKMQELTGTCALEGEEIGLEGSPGFCCQGLSAMPQVQASKDCTNLEIVSEVSICSNCGDGNCTRIHNENHCTCPEDCE